MIIYIITSNGKTLKDEAIQYILERIAICEGGKNYIYKCPDTNVIHHKLVTELEGLGYESRFVFYNTMHDWQVLNDYDKDLFIKELNQPLNWEIPLHKMLSNQLKLLQ